MGKKKKNKVNNLLKACIVLLIIVIIVEIVLIIKDESSNNKSQDTVVISGIETPITSIKCGFEAVDSLKVSVNEKKPYDVTFLADIDDAKDVEVLKIYFDEEKGTPIGTILDKDEKEVKVSIEQMEFIESETLDADMIIRLAYVQEDLMDTVISNLEIVEYASDEEVISSKSIMTETPYINLPFDKKWEEYLVVEQLDEEPYKVVYSCKIGKEEPVELFTYVFGEGATDIIGHLDGVPVGLVISEESPNKNWKQNEEDIFYEMKEEMNYIIDYLVSVDSFSLEQ